jgi:tetratricopeptide (TPR) repeat protein
MVRIARARAAAGDDAGALALLSKLVLRSHTARREALDGIEKILLAARGKGPAQMAELWKAGGRWLMDASREESLMAIADELRGAGAPYLELVRWLARYASSANRPKYLLLLARHSVETGDLAGCRDCIERLKGLRVSGDDLLRVEAAMRFGEQDYRGAARMLLSLRALDDADVAALGEVLPYAEDRAGAVALLERAVSGPDAGPGPLRRLADALYDDGRKAEAARYYRRAVEKDPADEWSCYRLAVVLGRHGGEEYLAKVGKDPLLVRMANAARKEMSLDAR